MQMTSWRRQLSSTTDGMTRRWFTADWHIGMSAALRFDKRGAEYGGPFKTVEEMNEALIRSAFQASPEDTIVHVGDLACFKSDRGHKGLEVKPMDLIS